MTETATRVRATFVVKDPATRQSIAELADQDALVAVRAVDSAADAWAATAPRVRSEILHKVLDLILRDRDELAQLIAAENGKSLTDAKTEVTYAADFFSWFAEETVRPGGEYGDAPDGARTLVTHRPVGVAAPVTPWNLSAAMATRKVAPALAASCTVVLKPAARSH